MFDSTRLIKKTCACTVLILFSFFGCAVRGMAEEKLVVGYFNIPPLSMKDPKTQQASGVAIDYFRKRIAPAIKVPIEFQELPFARMVDLLESGKIDAAVILGKNEQREKIFTYPEKPHILDLSGVALHKSSPVQKIEKIDDLIGLKILLAKGGFRTPFFLDNRLSFEEIAMGTSYVKSLLQMVQSQRKDAFFLPNLSVLRFEARRLGMQNDLKFLPSPEKPTEFFTAFRKDISQDILRSYNRVNMAPLTPEDLEEKSAEYQ